MKFSLRPGEKMIINGAVIGRGPEAGSFLVYNQAKLLRGREIMREEEADSPEKKLYLSIQLLYLFPESEEEMMVKYRLLHSQLSINRPDYQKELADINTLVTGGQYYKALKSAARLCGMVHA